MASREPAGAFASGQQRARVCQTLLTLVGVGERWTPHGPAPAARSAPPLEADPDARCMLAACWTLWDGCSTLSFDQLLLTSPRRLEVLGELLVAIARGPAAIDDWLSRFELPAPVRAAPRATRGRRPLSG